MAFSQLQEEANAMVEAGRLSQARPLLEELVKRVEASEDNEIELDFPLFLIGTAHIQDYVATQNKASLEEALRYYDRLQADYPESPHLKEALLKKVDLLRVLDRFDEAIGLLKSLLNGVSGQQLSYSEQLGILKDLSETYYYRNELSTGLPYFRQLLEFARDPEDRALAAAAAFEALIEEKDFDGAIELLPALAKDSEVRYQPRLNVALLKASDTLVEAERLTDAALLLNLIKTTDVMIDHYEQKESALNAQIEQREAFEADAEVIESLQQELKTVRNTLTQLRPLPTLRNELLVRRARNYTKTERRYEAFWMFHDLMVENPNDEQSEFYTFATFSNALQLEKEETVLEVGRAYRRQFPEGEYFSDVTVALAGALLEREEGSEFLQIVTDFLTLRPLDPASRILFAQWAGYLIENSRYQDLIDQAAAWDRMHGNASVYADAGFYWSGMAHLQLSEFAAAIEQMDLLLDKYPTSTYAEDGLLRKGTALFYESRYNEAKETLLSYRDKYPDGSALDQALYFLGELEKLAGNLQLALDYFEDALSMTASEEVRDSATFSIGGIYEGLGEYRKMARHFEDYLAAYPETSRRTDAIYQLGLAYEATQRPVEMLEIYREAIESFIAVDDDRGVDTLIEGYAERYEANLSRLRETVALLDRLESDLEFRRQMVTDRGFLFEVFYFNTALDQSLYNALRNHPAFGPELVDGLEPIKEVISVYRDQLAAYPTGSPEDFFHSLLAEARGRKDRLAETRALMGLYRLGQELAPADAFDRELLDRLTPRLLLYVADYSRDRDLEFATTVWNEVLAAYPQSDEAIVAYLRLADVSSGRDDLRGALNYLDQIVELFPGSPKVPGVILRQGALLTELGRTEEAREKYQYILRVPDWRGEIHARALYQTGEAFMADREFAKAHGFFERTFLGYSHFSEWSAKAYLRDAAALLEMNARDDAVRTLEEAIQVLGENGAAAELTAPIESKLEELRS